jgi:hypothetical protein
LHLDVRGRIQNTFLLCNLQLGQISLRVFLAGL